jgi:undecaprenyl-diphosphatase
LKLRNSVSRLAGFGVLLAAALVLSLAAAGDGVLPADVTVARFVQRAPQPPARWIADFGNWIGSARFSTFATLAVTVGLLYLRRPWELLVIALATTARALNGPLKDLFDSPRPTSDLVRVTEHAEGLGFPSGHSMGSMLFYGAIAVVAFRMFSSRRTRLSVLVTCLIVILLVGFGRIYVGAHWPSDVLGGYLWGALALSAIVWLVDVAHARWKLHRNVA